MKVHKGCGGKIENNKCKKCGSVFGKVRRTFGLGINEVEDRLDPKEYKKRIRRGDDIFK